MKQNYYQNGDIRKRQHEVIPKGKRLHWVPEFRLWLLIDKKLTKGQAELKTSLFVKSYQDSLSNIKF